MCLNYHSIHLYNGVFHPLQHPSLRKGSTQVIVNDRGHLNTDINRSPCSPWGSFVGTWQMERKPIQLKTKTRLTASLYRAYTPGSRQSSRASSARASKEIERLMSPQGSQPQTPQNASRPNTASDDSSWVIIDNLPSHNHSPVSVNSRPASQEKRESNCKESPLPQGSRIQSAASLRSPTVTPAGQSNRSGNVSQNTGVASVGNDVNISRGVSPTGSQKTASRPQSRRSEARESRSPLHLEQTAGSIASSPRSLTQAD